MQIRNKLKVKRFLKEQIWQLLIVVAFLFISAFVFGKYIESIMFCIAHTIIRNSFNKQYHCNTTILCMTFTVAISWIGISNTLPLGISIISSIPVCFLIAFLGFIAQDRLDLALTNKELQSKIDTLVSKLKENKGIDLYKMSETELRIFGASKFLSSVQQDILVDRIIYNLKISQICKLRNYSRSTIKYHISEIKNKLSIDTL